MILLSIEGATRNEVDFATKRIHQVITYCGEPEEIEGCIRLELEHDVYVGFDMRVTACDRPEDRGMRDSLLFEVWLFAPEDAKARFTLRSVGRHCLHYRTLEKCGPQV